MEQKRRTEESASRWISLIAMAMLEGLKGQAADRAFPREDLSVWPLRADTHLMAQNPPIYPLAN